MVKSNPGQTHLLLDDVTASCDCAAEVNSANAAFLANLIKSDNQDENADSHLWKLNFPDSK